MAVGAPRSAMHRREPSGRWWQYRYRGGRAFAGRRLYAPRGRYYRSNQCNTVRKTQLQLHSRYCAGCEHPPRATCHAGESIASCRDGSRVHRACQGQSRQDQHGGQIQVTFTDMAASIAYIRANRLRALAVTTAARSEALQDIPTIGDFVPGFEASQRVGLSAPKNTASEIINKLNSEINAGLTDPKLKARFADLGGMVLPGSVADFGKLIADDTEKWGKVIRTANIKPQ